MVDIEIDEDLGGGAILGGVMTGGLVVQVLLVRPAWPWTGHGAFVGEGSGLSLFGRLSVRSSLKDSKESRFEFVFLSSVNITTGAVCVRIGGGIGLFASCSVFVLASVLLGSLVSLVSGEDFFSETTFAEVLTAAGKAGVGSSCPCSNENFLLA